MQTGIFGGLGGEILISFDLSPQPVWLTAEC
jgi:hypothetical protein